MSKADQQKIVDQAKRRFKLAASAEGPQRKRESEVLKFDAGDQWPDDVKKFRGADTMNGVPIPARPMLTIPKTNQPVRLVVNQQRQAHLGILVHPESEDATDDTAEIIQGLIRHIEVRSRANLGRQWAFERAVKAGRGVYRILKEPAEFGWAEFGDQDITIKRVLNQASAYFDPFAQEPDWSDGRWAFLGGFLPWDRYVQEFPKSKLAKAIGDGDDDTGWEGIGDEAPDWVIDTDDGKAVRVMEYFCVHLDTYTRAAFVVQGQQIVAWVDKAPDDAPDDPIVDKADVPEDARTWDVEKRRVVWYKLNGIEVLEEQEWDGAYIPLIPVIGDEFNIDGKREFKGMIEPAMDGGRMFNYAASALVEKTALSSKAPWQVAEGQDETYEDEYAQANVRNFPVLHYKPTSLNGVLVPPPIRNFGSVDITPELAMLEQADSYIKSVTAVHDPSLGEDRKQRSGKATLALQQQADAANSNYLDNLAMAMTYEAKVLIDLIPKVYDRKGRVARILKVNDESERVMLNAPSVMPPGGKIPQQAPEGADGPEVKRYDLATGRYSVVVDIGRSYKNRAQQGADEIGTILQGVPQLMPIIGDLFFKYRDFPGAKEIAKRLEKMLPPQVKDEQDNGQPSVEQLQAQLQQGAQAFQQMQQQMGEMQKALETDQAKQSAAVEIARAKEDSAFEIAKMKAEFELEKTRIETQADITVEQIKAQMAGARQAYDAEIANEQAAASAQHESDEAERQRQHALEMADRGHQQSLEAAELEALNAQNAQADGDQGASV